MAKREYNGPWVRVRLSILERDGYLCQIQGPTCKTRATEVDHIIPIVEGGSRLDPTNLRSVCRPCHNTRKARHLLVIDPTTHPPPRDW